MISLSSEKVISKELTPKLKRIHNSFLNSSWWIIVYSWQLKRFQRMIKSENLWFQNQCFNQFKELQIHCLHQTMKYLCPKQKLMRNLMILKMKMKNKVVVFITQQPMFNISFHRKHRKLIDSKPSKSSKGKIRMNRMMTIMKEPTLLFQAVDIFIILVVEDSCTILQ